MEKWAVEPIYTGKNIFDYAELHYEKKEIELFDTYEEAEERKRIIEEKQNINCKISRQKIEIEEEQYFYLKII